MNFFLGILNDLVFFKKVKGERECAPLSRITFFLVEFADSMKRYTHNYKQV